MGLPAFADLDQFTARIPGGVSDADLPRAQTTLEDASSEIRAHCGESWVTAGAVDLPADPSWAADAVVRICCAVARRAFENPEGDTSQTIGSFSHTVATASPDIYLTSAEKRTLSSIVGGTSGLFTIETTRDDRTLGDLDFDGDRYIEVTDSELLPFLPLDAGSGL